MKHFLKFRTGYPLRPVRFLPMRLTEAETVPHLPRCLEDSAPNNEIKASKEPMRRTPERDALRKVSTTLELSVPFLSSTKIKPCPAQSKSPFTRREAYIRNHMHKKKAQLSLSRSLEPHTTVLWSQVATADPRHQSTFDEAANTYIIC